ncbi:Fe-S cluster assembly ATPase SufC [Clostridiaceae bacterium M8S5]|nr:Fe-S cluster assembly ATPase SufC [Clostridiaceae bacterium M8S5]
MSLLKVKNLKSRVDDKEILKGVNIEVNKGEVHIIMGPNGAGKSTLANVLMGHPKHEIEEGEIYIEDEISNELTADERAKKGLFLSFQYPVEIPGITVSEFLRTAKNAITGEKQTIGDFNELLTQKMKMLQMDISYGQRYLNQGFSGGEKKKSEILQMAVLEPKIAILDETDSGLDVDAIKVVSRGISQIRNTENAIIIITHYNKIIEYIKPTHVHILLDGKIIKSGDIELAEQIDREGFKSIKNYIVQ